MAPKRKKVIDAFVGSSRKFSKVNPGTSPVVQSAEKIKKKYRKPSSPRKDKNIRTRRALYDVQVKKVSIHKASIENNLSYSYLYRRVSGETAIDSRNGPGTVFSTQEEKELAEYLSEMAKRGMGLRPCEFLDLIQDIVLTEKRKTPFTNNRPSYEWYKKFMNRNKDSVGLRKEVLLEASRSRLTSERMDKWYSNFRDFLAEKDILNKPERIWNADETGFQMGSKAGYVIGPCRDKFPTQVPHMSGSSTKARLTVMFSASASGSMMPPFYVYPHPPPKGVNPLNCSLPGGVISYTEKGWMNFETFNKYIDHFDKYIVTEKPVVLLIDSVGSHINRKIFTKALSKGIELYRLVPNATHLCQPLDKGVFGPMKKQWYSTVRKHNREQPGVVINKTNFAEKLKDCFNDFYKPCTIVSSFRSSGIYPVNREVISDEQLKTNLTFSESDKASIVNVSEKETEHKSISDVQTDVHEQVFNAYESVLSTPVKQKYENRLQEQYDVKGLSPGYDTYVLLKSKVKSKSTTDEIIQAESSSDSVEKDQGESSALHFLADVATNLIQDPVYETPECTDLIQDAVCKTLDSSVSPVLKEALKLPKATVIKKKRKSTLDELPDHLTSPECIRKFEIKSLDNVRKFAQKEKKAKQAYLKAKEKSSVNTAVKGKSSFNTLKGKAVTKSIKGNRKSIVEPSMDLNNNEDVLCVVCEMTWAEDQTLMLGNTWIQCDNCTSWLHEDCIPIGFDYDKTEEKFLCHECKNDH